MDYKSDEPPGGSKTKLFCVEFSDVNLPKEDPVTPRCDQLESQFLEAKHFANKDPVLVPADVPAIVHPSQKQTLGVGKIWHFAWQPDRAGMIET